MPPSPRITPTLNAELYEQLCGFLGISPPRINFRHATNDRIYGVAHHDGSITIYHGLSEQIVDRLRSITTDMVFTILHELRHQQQRKTWSDEKWNNDHKLPYALRECERDANEFASINTVRWRGLVRIKREQHGSGFSKLSRHAH